VSNEETLASAILTALAQVAATNVKYELNSIVKAMLESGIRRSIELYSRNEENTIIEDYPEKIGLYNPIYVTVGSIKDGSICMKVTAFGYYVEVINFPLELLEKGVTVEEFGPYLSFERTQTIQI
jgi:hypothetical protein